MTDPLLLPLRQKMAADWATEDAVTAAARKNALATLDAIVVPGTGPITPPPGAGGKAALRAALGQQQNRYAYIASLTQKWNAVPGGPISWAWNTNTCVESTDDLAHWLNDCPANGPVTVLRQGYPILEILAGAHDGEIDTYAALLQQVTVKQGRAQILRPLYEGPDQNVPGWMRWNLAGVTNDQWASAFVYVVQRFRRRCPTVKVDLCMNIGRGDGPTNIFGHGRKQWDAIVFLIQSKGVKVDYADWDAYPNGLPGGQWLADELVLLEQCAKGWGCQVAHGEWGIASAALPGAEGPFDIDTTTWSNTFCDWWMGLPAIGAGSLGHIEIFDLGGDGVFPNGRGGILVPTEGPKMGTAFKTKLAA